jgi:glycerophosphoryl diester phosphodiesterase
VNAVEEARRFIAKDVDGIATDRPDIFSGMA